MLISIDLNVLLNILIQKYRRKKKFYINNKEKNGINTEQNASRITFVGTTGHKVDKRDNPVYTGRMVTLTYILL